jgi:hypothetical protein
MHETLVTQDEKRLVSVNDGDTFTDANVPEDWKGAEKGGKGDSAGGEDV